MISVVIYSTAARLGYASLKPCQESAVKAFISGKDIFVSLPTRYGKSFRYAVFPGYLISFQEINVRIIR